MPRITLFVGTPEHTAFPASIALALEEVTMQGWDEGFMQTAAQHQKFFDKEKDYTLLTQDFQYIMELATQAIGRHARTKH